MFVIRKNGKDFTLPLTDQQMIRIEKETSIDLFVPVADAQCIKAECGGMNLREKLPKKIWPQEMNMLAYTIQQFSPTQERQFLKVIAEEASMYLGEMLNHALCICPEAVGPQRGYALKPYYTGENLFDIMEYKRFQDRRTEYPQLQMAKFYVPVDILFVCKANGDDRELSPAEASVYLEPLSQMLADRIRPCDNWSDWTTYPYLFRNSPYCDIGLMFEHPDVEIRNGELWGVIYVETSHVLSNVEIKSLKEYFDGSISDGWGEDLRPVELPEGRLHIIFNECTEVLQQGTGEIYLDEPEMFLLQAPFLHQRVLNHTGFTADFQSEWEYGRTCPIWMELSSNRKTIRVPLPAKEKAVWDARIRIGASNNDPVRVRLKTHKVRIIDNMIFGHIDLQAFNKVASEIHLMESDAEESLCKMIPERGRSYEELVSIVGQTLEQIRIEGHAMESGKGSGK